MRNFALLILRLTVGGLLAGHGAQKLFGVFGGHGLEGTSGWMESMGMRPGKPWATLAGASEFGGGLLTLLGFLNPIGPISAIGAMTMAALKVHWGKPIWASSGGAELPVTNIAAALAVAMSGPGDISLDNALGLKLPRRPLLVAGLLAVAATVAGGIYMSNQVQAQQAQQATQPAEEVQLPAEAPSESMNEPAVRMPDQMMTNEQAAETADRIAGGELQAGQDASHPV